MSAVLQDQPEPMSDVDLCGVIDNAEERSYGSGISSMTAELAAQRALIISLFLGENISPVDEGSNAIDRTVFEVVMDILPSLCRIFANGEDVVNLPPVGPGDIQGSKQETAYLNWLVCTTMPWFEIFLEYAVDALLAPNSYLLAYRDRKRTVEIEKYEGQTKQGVSYLLQDPNVQLIGSESYQATDLPPEPVIDPQTGQPAMQMAIDPMTGQQIMQPIMAPAMLYNVVIRRASDAKKLCGRVLPPERVKIDQNTNSWRINESTNYFEYWEKTTLSDLRSQGFDVPDDLADASETITTEDNARDQYGEIRLERHSSIDPSMREVVARMIWIRVDADRDGIAELLSVLRVGEKILYREEVSRIPVASGSSCPLPHRHPGMPVGQQVADIQIIKTDVLREGLNNLYLSNNPQKVLNPSMVNVDDALVSRPGGVIRADDVTQIRHETPPFVFPQAVQGLEYLSQIAQGRAGVNAGMASIDSSSLTNVQPGVVNQLSSIAAEKTVQIARVLAFGIEDFFSIVHEQVLKMGHKKQAIKISGEWVEVDPGAWKRRDNFKICVAFGSGNRDAQIGRLAMVAQKQEQALLAGVPVCTPENYYATLTELTKAIDITAVDRFWTDPAKMPPKPPPPPPSEIITHQMDNQSREQIKGAELAQAERESVRKTDLERYAIDSNNGIEIIHKHLDHGHTVAIEGLKASHAAILEGLGAKFDNEHSATSRAVDKAHEAINSNTNRLTDIHEHLDKVFKSVQQAGKLATAKRHMRRNAKGEVDGIDLIDHDGTVLASHTAIKDQAGRIIGMQ